MKPLSDTAKTLAEGLLSLVYPPTCLGCGGRVQNPADPLCATCAHRLERVERSEVEARLAGLEERGQTLDAGFALWHFDREGTLQRVQHALKYGHRPRFGNVLGGWMAPRLLEAWPGPLPDVVVPIPLHRTRYLERGYNQAAQIGEGLAQGLGLPCCADLLVRPRATRSQTHLSRAHRWSNVEGAFAVPTPAAVAGRRLVLVDDVLTTGATLAAAAATLHAAGAAWVGAATLALART